MLDGRRTESATKTTGGILTANDLRQSKELIDQLHDLGFRYTESNEYTRGVFVRAFNKGRVVVGEGATLPAALREAVAMAKKPIQHSDPLCEKCHTYHLPIAACPEVFIQKEG
jgi:hypothetical protein